MSVPVHCWEEFMQALTARYFCSVTSWYRTTHHNVAVGGCPHSKHLSGDAVDVVYDPGVHQWPTLGTLQEWCRVLGYRVIREATHDHFERGS